MHQAAVYSLLQAQGNGICWSSMTSAGFGDEPCRRAE
jgi:hypothetical protein